MKRNFGNKMPQAGAHQPALNFAWTTLSSRRSRCMIQIHFVDVFGRQITAAVIGSNWSALPNNFES